MQTKVKIIGFLSLIAIACTPQQIQQAQDVTAQAKTVCESRFVERLAPVLLTKEQANLALEAARYACTAAQSQCVDEVLAARRDAVEPPKAEDAGAPAPATEPASAPESPAAPALEQRQ